MRLKERLIAMFGPTPPPHDPGEPLTEHEDNIALRLSRLTGRTRDDVLAEAYRKADKVLSKR